MSGMYSFLIVLFTFYFTQQLWISSPHFSVFMEYTFCLLETVLTKQTNWWGTWCDNKIVLSLLWILPCTIFLEAAFYADLLPFSWRTSKPTLTWESQLRSEWSCQALLQTPSFSKQIFFWKYFKKIINRWQNQPIFASEKSPVHGQSAKFCSGTDICFLTSTGIMWDVNLYIAGILAACFSARREHY